MKYLKGSAQIWMWKSFMFHIYFHYIAWRSFYAVFLVHLHFDYNPSIRPRVEFSTWNIMSALKKVWTLEFFRFLSAVIWSGIIVGAVITWDLWTQKTKMLVSSVSQTLKSELCRAGARMCVDGWWLGNAHASEETWQSNSRKPEEKAKEATKH